jgi:hypothetical protein
LKRVPLHCIEKAIASANNTNNIYPNKKKASKRGRYRFTHGNLFCLRVLVGKKGGAIC